MSTDRAGCRSLGEYLRELVGRLAAAEPAAFAELRATVGERRARISLDEESVVVAFHGDLLGVHDTAGPAGPRSPAGPGRPAVPVDGEGATDGACVADLLRGYAEVSGVVLDGRLEVRGPLDAVTAMLAAIEIILDTSARAPALQSLARDFLADPCRPAPAPRLPADARSATHWGPGTVTREETQLLARLDLLPDEPRG